MHRAIALALRMAALALVPHAATAATRGPAPAQPPRDAIAHRAPSHADGRPANADGDGCADSTMTRALLHLAAQRSPADSALALARARAGVVVDLAFHADSLSRVLSYAAAVRWREERAACASTLGAMAARALLRSGDTTAAAGQYLSAAGYAASLGEVDDEREAERWEVRTRALLDEAGRLPQATTDPVFRAGLLARRVRWGADSDRASIALRRELVGLRRRIGDAEGELAAIADLVPRLDADDSTVVALAERGARLGLPDDDAPRALRALPPADARRLARILPWEEMTREGISGLFGEMPGEFAKLRVFAGVLHARGDDANAARVLQVAAGILEPRVNVFIVDSTKRDSALALLGESLRLRRAAHDSAGAVRTLRHIAWDRLTWATRGDTAEARRALALLDSARRAARRASAFGEDARIAMLQAGVQERLSFDDRMLRATLAPAARALLAGGDSAAALKLALRDAALVFRRGQLDSARASVAALEPVARAVGAVAGATMARTLAAIDDSRGALDSAAADLDRAEDACRATSDFGCLAGVELARAEVEDGRGNARGMRERLMRVLLVHDLFVDSDNAAELTRLRGRAYVQLAQYDSAEVAFALAPLDDADAPGRFDAAAMQEARARFDSALTLASAALDSARDATDVIDRVAVARGLATEARLLLRRATRVDSALVYLARAGSYWHAARRDSLAAVTFVEAAQLERKIGRLDRYAALLDSARAVPAAGARLAAVPGPARYTTTMSFADSLQAARDGGDVLTEAQLLEHAGDADRRQADGAARALAHYDSAAAVLSQLLRGTGAEENRTALAQRSEAIGEKEALVMVGSALGGDEQRRAIAALGFVDANRGGVLAALRGTTEFDNDSLTQGILHGFGEFFYATIGSRALLEPQKAASIHTDPVAPSDTVYENWRRDLSVLDPGVDLLSYLSTPDTLLVWLRPHTLDADSVFVSRVPVGRDSLARLVDSLRVALGVVLPGSLVSGSVDTTARGVHAGVKTDSTRARRLLLTLGELLFPASVRSRLAESGMLVVSPHAAISLIPFAALRLGDGAAPLGARFAIRYVPSFRIASSMELERSASMYQRRWRVSPTFGLDFDEHGNLRRRVDMTPYRDSVAWRRSALIVGDPTMPVPPAGLALTPLPIAGTEARDIASRFGVKALTRDSATELAVRERMRTATVIHLATHGVAFAGQAAGRQSFIALARSQRASDTSSDADGVLTMDELLGERGLATQADLVVLSACESAVGDLNTAEGTLGLQRAFLARGAMSVLASLWSVDDRATQRLMERFYAHWLGDRDRPDKSESLRRAQEELRTDRAHPQWADPRYWAAFQLVGID